MSSIKRDRFIRVAEARTKKVLSMLRLIGNCSNKATYEYSDADITKIFKAIESEVRNSKAKFQSTKDDAFKLTN